MMLNQKFQLYRVEKPKMLSNTNHKHLSIFGKYNGGNSWDDDGENFSYDSDSLDSLSSCEKRLFDIDVKMTELKTQRNLTQIAMVKCLEGCVSSNLLKSYVEQIFTDYMKNGFNSTVFQAFFKEVKNSFFCVPDANGSLDYLKSVECTYFDGGGWANWNRSLDRYNCCERHCCLQFHDNNKNFNFSLCLPILDNTEFCCDNLEDNLLGRYYVNSEIYRTDDSVSFKACDTAKFIMELLTTNKYIITIRDWAKEEIYQQT